MLPQLAYPKSGKRYWRSRKASPATRLESSPHGKKAMKKTAAGGDWRDVRCSNRTGHVLKLQLRDDRFNMYGYTVTPLVGQISRSLLNLENLEYLDLSSNELESSTGRIPEFLGSLRNLKYLNLSSIQSLGHPVPPQLGNLSKLQYLDLSNMGLGYTYPGDLSWLAHLSSLHYLNLEGVFGVADNWIRVLNMIPSLRVLDLSNCFLTSANQSLSHLLNLTNLEELYLSDNYFNHPISPCWFWNITTLKYLDLGGRGLYGQLPNALGGMTSLQYLSLASIRSNLSMTGKILKNLCNLTILDLENCYSNGNIADLIHILTQCSSGNKFVELSLGSNNLAGNILNLMGQFTNLATLYLDRNNITGNLPSFIGYFSSLRVLDLSYNHLSGHVPYEIGTLTNLINLDLSYNHLSGHVPYEIGTLTKLTNLDLRSNDLDGVINEDHFTSTRSLQSIDLSYNSLKVELSPEWKPPFRLIYAYFATCQMGPLFPAWLQWQVDVLYIDISSNGVTDRFPIWFHSSLSNLLYLNISHNQVEGDLPKHMQNMPLQELYLSSNELTGQIPQLPPNMTNLDISRNSLSGPLPSNFGGLFLVELSLFSNQITGRIPMSICDCDELDVLDLANNFLDGELPICSGKKMMITNLELSNNSLSGPFPLFLRNCTRLQFLDLAGNKFFGRLPTWIGNLVELMFLRLNHNMFSGSIPTNIINLECLRYLDIASNGLSGSIPKSILNLRSMREKYWGEPYLFCLSRQPFQYHSVSLSAFTKGQLLDYGSIDRLMYVNMMRIDLSSNHLTGEIPEEIDTLIVLWSLNFSRNHFTGNLPYRIGALQSLESLDLSRNELSGNIPQSLSRLTFLSYLDLSYNNLTGSIPSGSQLDTLYAANPLMYTGNVGLCGRPLTKNCSSNYKPRQLRRIQGEYPDFLYLGLACGFIVGNWVVSCTLLYKKSWRIAYFCLFDKLYDKAYVLVVVTVARLVRKTTNSFRRSNYYAG